MQSVAVVVGIIREVDRNEIFEDVMELYKDGEIVVPDRIALPTLLMILFGSDVFIPTNIMMDAFMDYNSTTEQETLKRAI